jgi:ribose-phosphate pyrophosphokinase
VYACCTHAVFSERAAKILQASPLKEVIATDSINIDNSHHFPKLNILSVASLFAEAIIRIHKQQPVSKLFD